MSTTNEQAQTDRIVEPSKFRLLWVLFAGLAILLLIWICTHVFIDSIYAFDRSILLFVQALGDPADPAAPPVLIRLARDVTSLGSATVMTLITLSVSGFLMLTRRHRTSLLVLASVAGGAVLSKLLKFAFDRPRPDVMPHAEEVYNASFPSGHAMMAAITYLTLGALLTGVQKDAQMKRYILIWSVSLTVLVGTSRIILGVHWPTDVIGGWCVGSIWALVCWSFGERIRTSGSPNSSI